MIVSNFVAAPQVFSQSIFCPIFPLEGGFTDKEGFSRPAQRRVIRVIPIGHAGFPNFDWAGRILATAAGRRDD